MNTQIPLYEKRLGHLHDVLPLMDKGVRYLVLLLNQAGYVTFTSCEGHSSTELPRIGILCPDLDYVANIISYVEQSKLNIWYELSNRWLATKEEESEIDRSDEENIHDVLAALRLDWPRCYFLTLKVKTLNDLKKMTEELVAL